MIMSYSSKTETYRPRKSKVRITSRKATLVTGLSLRVKIRATKAKAEVGRLISIRVSGKPSDIQIWNETETDRNTTA